MENNLHEISASTVIIEVTDKKTGLTYRRALPIDYVETANCLRLRGENLNGATSELVFFTDRGMSRMKDLTGGGADVDGCKQSP